MRSDEQVKGPVPFPDSLVMNVGKSSAPQQSSQFIDRPKPETIGRKGHRTHCLGISDTDDCPL